VIRALMLALVVVAAAAASPQRVEVGLYLSNVNDIDLVAGTYTADFYMWFRWKGKLDPTQTVEFKNMVERWGTTERPLEEEPVVLEDGTRYQLIHYQGMFNNKFPLHAYPLDEQDILLEIEDLEHTRADIQYVPLVAESGFNPALRLPGWELAGHAIEVGEYRYPTRFGLPASHQRTSAYSRLTYRLHLRRPLWGYTFKMLLPVVIVLASTFAIFWLAPDQVDSRVSIAVTGLLSAVALNITVVSNLPEVGYQVLVDKIYNLSYLVIFFALLATIWAVRLDEAGRREDALLLDARCAWALPLLFTVGTGLLIVMR
jgi:hypothetical protein